ncbi:MAG: tRNA (N(6)-L-threonylcarbamoyladenosine(37)-C(2))-methylthiotransferase MtaB, partial [Clostridiales bacterium]|nr:tRNA (N(6)-L-threonylcarbamoyladenosine(37)-C(2))-methylthiotransferase MtaB [Clostridiales bacterium]
GCPQLRLSLQSGAARPLAAMGRGYTPEGYAGITRALRGVDPLFSLTTDVIVGFPGETEADFEESLSFVKGMGFARVHVFKYSKRPGTRAAGMEGQVPEAVKNARSRLMIQAAGEGAARFLALNEGCIRQALIFGPDRSGSFLRGLTDNGIDLALPAGGCGYVPNTFADVELKPEFFL